MGETSEGKRVPYNLKKTRGICLLSKALERDRKEEKGEKGSAWQVETIGKKHIGVLQS